MPCRRCGGFMIVEPFHEEVWTETAPERELLGTRCVNCGNIEDAVIHTNRLEPRSVRRAARHNLGVEMGSGSPRTERSCEGSSGLTS